MQVTEFAASAAQLVEEDAQFPLGRGYVEGIVPIDDEVHVGGWLLSLAGPADSFYWKTTDGRTGRSAVAQRPDVAAVYPWLPHGEQCGFMINIGQVEPGDVIWLRVVGMLNGDPVATIVQPIRSDLAGLPAPPEQLAFRVAHTRSVDYFRASGLKMCSDLLGAVERHRSMSSVARILDWGSGCGRTSMHLAALSGCPELFGCDVDSQAISWAVAMISGARFTTVAPYPPTDYPADFFDFVISCSVLTHLDRELQAKWLSEIARVLAPGGTVAASVHGEYAARWSSVSVDHLLSAGILDWATDPTLDGIVPKDYYRATFQSPEYTARTFSKHLEMLEYRAAAAGNFQDLIVARKPPA
jgi:SAM-dependent methyltransferase